MPAVTELGKVKDKTQTIVSVNLSSTLGGSIIVPFFLREAASLIEKGWCVKKVNNQKNTFEMFKSIKKEY